MGIVSMWREARGRVMRKEYEDARARIRNALFRVINSAAYRRFSN